MDAVFRVSGASLAESHVELGGGYVAGKTRCGKKTDKKDMNGGFFEKKAN